MPASKLKEVEDFQEVADKYARRCLATLSDELDALHHAQACDGFAADGEPCKRGSEVKHGKLKDGKPYTQMIHSNPEAWHDEDNARRVIEEGHFGVQVRSDWHSPGATGKIAEYIITLGGGEPAARIIGELDRGEPCSAHFEYQDWFKPWTEARLSDEEEALLLEWAQIVVYY